MKKEIDINTWKRKEHFSFFNRYEEPFFGITANVDCTKAYARAKGMEMSFFLYYMHKSLVACNAVEEFRYRIENGQPTIYDTIHGSTTVQNADELFAFAFLPYHHDFNAFYRHAKSAVEKTKLIKGIGANEDNSRIDVIHYSTVPWISFTSITHERNFAHPDSIPKITFGKYFYEGSKLLMPVAVYGHHGLMDGLHIAEYFEVFQRLLNL